jgi:hypothetical protein
MGASTLGLATVLNERGIRGRGRGCRGSLVTSDEVSRPKRRLLLNL